MSFHHCFWDFYEAPITCSFLSAFVLLTLVIMSGKIFTLRYKTSKPLVFCHRWRRLRYLYIIIYIYKWPHYCYCYTRRNKNVCLFSQQAVRDWISQWWKIQFCPNGKTVVTAKLRVYCNMQYIGHSIFSSERIFLSKTLYYIKKKIIKNNISEYWSIDSYFALLAYFFSKYIKAVLINHRTLKNNKQL